MKNKSGGSELPDPGEQAHGPSAGFLDHAERLKAWAQASDRDVRRKAVLHDVQQGISQAAEPTGHVFDGKSWRRVGRRLESWIALQKGRSGDRCFVNVGVTGRGFWKYSPMAVRNQQHRLGKFYHRDENDWGESGVIFCYDGAERPEKLLFALKVLQERALPWLNAQHAGFRAPEVAEFIPDAPQT